MLKKVQKTIRCKSYFIVYFLLIQLFITPIASANILDSFNKEDHSFNVLVVYTNKLGQIDENVRQLDLLLGHFTSNLNFKSDQDVTGKDFKGVTHVFYYGISQQKIYPTFLNLINNYQGHLIVMGHNIKQFENRYTFMDVRDQIWVNSITLNNHQNQVYLDQRLPIYHIVGKKDGVYVHINALKGGHIFPLFIQYENTYYYASESLFGNFGILFGESLHHVFQLQPEKSHLAYLRLEDVHPLSDPKLLREIAEYLWQKKIPYLIAVIPVYVDEKNSKPVHFRDKPELVDTLTYMQNHGGSIILHGYTHKYKNHETGEGFEFWDVENDSPIYGLDKNDSIKQRYEFDSEKAYQKYLQTLYQFEEEYIRNRIESGIRELVDLKLYPLGFEPPHYTMSQEGYQIVSQYFDAFFGQVQLSNSSWKSMGATPYLTKPKMLHGMLLYPETIGYFDPSSRTPYQDINKKLEVMINNTSNGMVGFFYHPYLGLANLKPIINHLNKVPDLEWLNLKHHHLKVTTPYLEITSDKGEPITVVDTLSMKQRLWQQISVGTFEFVLWSVASIVAIMVFIFFIYTILLKLRLRKRLFDERDVSNG